ncbi:SDR family oxidoreductase [Poseidonibacter lekithochrous]|uniref:SDR family oxidoreductase n=1 Tax=Poseidonibacter TaxID=2321187 RepID=UPI001C09C05F|nr:MULTISPECIES: SDR family oxidoreductase [Poseidonibacter]MBU3013884.1 SDR family oxidoreductase [Poseidonibacter lekithochrous]MDO6827178.1 SDR family oxidoreductase [Poseidonibacter sp. 1_MG-2023]
MKVLLTGSTGYIGRRLKEKLLEKEDITLRLFTRNKKTLSAKTINTLEVVEGDTFDKDSLRQALKEIDVAFYLIHSLSSENYKDLDKLSAQNFLDVANECGVKRIIYLGGLGVKNKDTSEHLLSRIETGEILSSNKNVQNIWIRAGVIIGSGSTSFEIIRNLTEKLPIMTTPKWVETKAQPIAVHDVINYLIESLYLKQSENLVIDIGAEQLKYKEMMLQTAEALGLKRIIIPLPFLSINISSYWLNLFTPVPFTVAKALIEGLKSEVVIQNDNAKKYFPNIKPLNFITSVKKAVEEIETNQVISRWSDNSGKIWDRNHTKEIADAIFFDRKEKDISDLSKENIYKTFTSIGGKNGWFDYDFLWEARGFIDKMIGGVGLKRGRRDPNKLRIGESLDFWKVVDVKENERLLLYAQMKVPGNAWLEFKIEDNKLIQSAYFYPKGVLGRLYWYTLIPIHYFVFNNMINSIIKKAATK